MRFYMPARRSIFILLSVLTSLRLTAQPNLPDIAAASKDGINVLTWNCQFSGIKNIAVKRSKDSAGIYTSVGNVKDLKKGIQVFADGHPMPGNNWYQLSLSFESGLTWNSNKIKLHVDSNTLAKEKVILPPNDSLQKLVSASEAGKPHAKQEAGKIVVNVDSTRTGSVTTEKTLSTDARIGPKITISMGNASNDMNGVGYMKGEHVYTDPLTGHVKLDVPDVKKHVYSIKFYNDQGQMIIEVPRLSASPVIMDKRNFNKKGVYKFVLRRNNAEYETGYITIY